MGYAIEEIEGIGPKYGEKLRACEIITTEDLLAKCAKKPGRTAVANDTGISDTLLRDWANMADLMRIKGVGEEYSDLLEEAGVDTVKELRNRNAANLAEKMAEVNEAKNLTNRVPSEKVVQGWVDQAKELAPTEFTY